MAGQWAAVKGPVIDDVLNRWRDDELWVLRPGLPHVEAGYPFERLRMRIDLFHVSPWWAVACPLHHRPDAVPGAFENGLDRPVRAISNPAGHTTGSGFAAAGVAEEHPLHPAVHDDSAAYRIGHGCQA